MNEHNPEDFKKLTLSKETKKMVDIFRLDKSIRLFEQKGFEIENYNQIEYLILFKGKLFIQKIKRIQIIIIF